LTLFSLFAILQVEQEFFSPVYHSLQLKQGTFIVSQPVCRINRMQTWSKKHLENYLLKKSFREGELYEKRLL